MRKLVTLLRQLLCCHRWQSLHWPDLEFADGYRCWKCGKEWYL